MVKLLLELGGDLSRVNVVGNDFVAIAGKFQRLLALNAPSASSLSTVDMLMSSVTLKLDVPPCGLRSFQVLSIALQTSFNLCLKSLCQLYIWAWHVRVSSQPDL